MKTVLKFCTDIGSIPTIYVLSQKRFKFFKVIEDDSCFSKAVLSILKVFARQVVYVTAIIMTERRLRSGKR